MSELSNDAAQLDRCDVILQAICLGAILENPKRLKTTQISNFSDVDMQNIVASLTDGGHEKLSDWLRSLGVTWAKGNGRAIDSVVAKVQKTAAIDRAREVRKRARYLLADTPQQLADELDRLKSHLGLNEKVDAGNNRGD